MDALARSLVRVESLASSRIAGIRVSSQRLARVPHLGTGVGDSRARARVGDSRAVAVHGNVEAVERAVEIGRPGSAFNLGDVEQIHRTLLRLTEDGDVAGAVRGPAEWIGADEYNPVGADFVPPPPEQLKGFLEGLCTFVERTDLPPTAQAAIAHAQFKNIHPFAVGNGRTGRALVHTVLGRRGATKALIAPVSAVLASEAKEYVGGVGAYSVGQVDAWCAVFAHATARAAHGARVLVDAIEARTALWLERLANPRSDSAVRQILRELPAHPVLDSRLAERLTGKSHTAAGHALNQLERAGVLRPLPDGRRGRAWEASELLELLDGYVALG